MDYPVLCLRNNSLLKSLAQNVVTLMCFFNNICFQSCLGQTCTPLISGGKFFSKKYVPNFWEHWWPNGRKMSYITSTVCLQLLFILKNLLFSLQNKSYEESRNHCAVCMRFCFKKNCVDRDVNCQDCQETRQ